MKTHLSFQGFAFFGFLLLASCAIPHPYKGKPTYVADGNVYCSLHNQQLIQAHGYLQSKDTCVYPSEGYFKWYSTYPNSIPCNISATKGISFHEPVNYSYCQACESAIDKAENEEWQRAKLKIK